MKCRDHAPIHLEKEAWHGFVILQCEEQGGGILERDRS